MMNRVKPHGIKYHPGVVLDIIYGKKPSSFNNNNNNSNNNSSSKKNRINDTQDAIVKTEDPTAGATPPGQDRSSSGQDKKEENLDVYVGGETLARIQEGAVDGDQEEEGKGNDEADSAEEKSETQIEEQEE